MTVLIRPALAAGALLAAAAPAHAALDPALACVLEAAAQSRSEGDFADAVRVLSLAAAPGDIAAAASALSPERGAEARALLGLNAPDADASTPGSADEGAQDGAPAWRALPVAAARTVARGDSDLWTGRASLAARFDTGNSDRQDYVLGLSVERALAGWGFEAKTEYAYSEVDGAVGRDAFLFGARGERETGERWTAYAQLDYEQDQLSGFDWTGFLGAGAGYRAIEREGANWTLRAGPGARFINQAGAVTTEAALNLGSDLALQLTDALAFASETDVLLADRSRADQLFTLSTGLGELWSLELKYRYRYEFEPEPGFENADQRTDLSIVREF